MGDVIDETAGLVGKFPNLVGELRQLYMASEPFRDLVRDFNDATAALAFWTSAQQPDRQQEYRDILIELKTAISDMLDKA